MKTDQHELGPILYTHGKKHICEGGVCDNKQSILWDEVDSLFLNAQKVSVNFLQAGESMAVEVVSKTGDAISLSRRGFFEIRRKDKENFWNLYQFIVSKILDRQWSELITDLRKGTRVSFESFDLTSTKIYRRTVFGGYDIIDLSRIRRYDFICGELLIEFVNDKGRLKRKSLGHTPEIPNVHLVQAFLSSIGHQNSGQ